MIVILRLVLKMMNYFNLEEELKLQDVYEHVGEDDFTYDRLSHDLLNQ